MQTITVKRRAGKHETYIARSSDNVSITVSCEGNDRDANYFQAMKKLVQILNWQEKEFSVGILDNETKVFVPATQETLRVIK